MTVPEAAIEAAAEAHYTDFMLDMDDDYQWPWSKQSDKQKTYWRERVETVLEAAMPAIRETLAQEIEATEYDDPATDFQSGYNMCVENAARIVRGGTL